MMFPAGGGWPVICIKSDFPQQTKGGLEGQQNLGHALIYPKMEWES